LVEYEETFDLKDLRAVTVQLLRYPALVPEHTAFSQRGPVPSETDALYLGAMATETKIRQLSESGALAKYKIVHFATHGAVAGDMSSASEPGLLLTLPEQASETDDGYLTASEISTLKLDADWVILSACNTAAGGAQGAEALSGLARAFFYAGALAAGLALGSQFEFNSQTHHQGNCRIEL
jgi:hypothetical protein